MKVTSAAIKLDGVFKNFFRKGNLLDLFRLRPQREQVCVLKDVSLMIPQGEIAVLTGPNGAGKTTLMKILAGLILPDSGEISISGSLYFIPTQDRTFYERLTAKANLEFFGTLKNLSSSEIRKRIFEISETLNLDFLDARYQELSSGMKQKLSIARCLLMDPDILLMDEPWRGLDPEFSSLLHSKLKEHLKNHKQKTVLYTTHDLTDLSWAGRHWSLTEGRLREIHP